MHAHTRCRTRRRTRRRNRRHNRFKPTCRPLSCRLQGGSDLNACSEEGYTPLQVAALCGRARVVRALLDRGAELSRRSRRGATALHFAARSAGNLEVLQMLLAHPACSPELVKLKGHRQRSALLLAVLSRDEPAAVKALLEAGADPSERCASMGNTSLLHSCAHLARWVGG